MRKNSRPDASQAWTERWIESVATGKATMSQRKLTSVERHGGGLSGVKAVAVARGVHLVQLTDDQGDMLTAASRHPFAEVC